MSNKTKHNNLMQNNFHFWNNSFWFTGEELAEIFEVSETVVLDNFAIVCDTGELLESEVSAKNKSGKLFLNLNAAISVAYRIDNVKATKFRIETGRKLLEEILKNRTDRTNSSNSFFPKHGGYKNLKSYQFPKRQN